MNKYTIEYQKAELPHKKVIRFASNVNAIKYIDLIISTSFKVLIWNKGKIIAKYTCE